MRRVFTVFMVIFWLGLWTNAQGQPTDIGQSPASMPSTLTVRGSGEVTAPPDRAVVQLGAAVRSEKAADAQIQVNRTVAAVLEAIKAIGISGDNISTAELTLVPVYDRTSRVKSETDAFPRIAGYQATNVVRVDIPQINRVGEVIDVALRAGANRLERLFFELKDDAFVRQKALQQAVLSARRKAQAIAEAMNLRLVRVLEVSEEGVHTVRPRYQAQQTARAAVESTPVEFGSIQVNAAVVVTYQVENMN